MSKKKRLLCIICALMLLSSCTPLEANEDRPEKSEFFVWMDSYIAAPAGSEWTIAVTYYFRPDQPHLDINGIQRISFADIDQIEVVSFETGDVSMGEDAEYEGRSITLKLSFGDTGIYRTEEMVLHLSDGSTVQYPIGAWVFDVDREPDAVSVVDQNGSPAASSQSNVFPFQYTVLDEDAQIEKIQYGENDEFTSFSGKDEICKIALTSEAPVVYIRPKIVVKTGEETSIEYGNGCYCGALDFDESDVQRSIDYAGEKEAARLT